MRERYGAKDPRSWLLRTHAQTAGCALTAQQPYNNVVRVAIQALAAVLGGAQSLHTNALDETRALPTEKAATIALRTQQIIAHETGVTHTIDPVGGSYFVETLTREIEEEAWTYLQKIDDLGGMVQAVEKGFPQQEIADASYRYQQAVERGEQVVVGVNRCVAEVEEPIPLLQIDPDKAAHQQMEKIHQLKKRRDSHPVNHTLDAIRRAAQGKDPWARDLLMPKILDAVRAYATLGEIMGVLREAWGEATIALRTQQIIAHETGVTHTIDPVGGSYFVETLTREIEEEAWTYLQKIDDLGGMVQAVEKGFPQQEIADASYRYQQAVERGEQVVVGVNRCVAEVEEPIPLLQIDPDKAAHQQMEKIHQLKKRRDSHSVDHTLDAIRRAAQGKDPWARDLLMPKILDAVRAYVTLGEIMGVLREAWGEYVEPAIL